MLVSYPYYPYSYGGYSQYPQPGMYGQQQLITNYPASNYYNAGGMMGGYYPNTNAYITQGGYGGGYGGAYGGTAGYNYGGANGYLPYKQSTLRTIYNRLRHGSSYGSYPYYNQSGYPQGMGYEYGGRHHHRGSYLDYN